MAAIEPSALVAREVEKFKDVKNIPWRNCSRSIGQNIASPLDRGQRNRPRRSRKAFSHVDTRQIPRDNLDMSDLIHIQENKSLATR